MQIMLRPARVGVPHYYVPRFTKLAFKKKRLVAQAAARLGHRGFSVASVPPPLLKQTKVPALSLIQIDEVFVDCLW